MEGRIDRAAFLESLRSERRRWDEILAEVSEGRMEEAGVEGEWTVKDIIAHITWHEREMVEMLRHRSPESGSDLWMLPTHERNAAIFEQNRHHSLEEVLNESREIFPQLVQETEALSEEDLYDPGRFAGMPSDWVPWKILAGNSYEHYRDHVPSLRTLLATKGN